MAGRLLSIPVTDGILRVDVSVRVRRLDGAHSIGSEYYLKFSPVQTGGGVRSDGGSGASKLTPLGKVVRSDGGRPVICWDHAIRFPTLFRLDRSRSSSASRPFESLYLPITAYAQPPGTGAPASRSSGAKGAAGSTAPSGSQTSSGAVRLSHFDIPLHKCLATFVDPASITSAIATARSASRSPVREAARAVGLSRSGSRSRSPTASRNLDSAPQHPPPFLSALCGEWRTFSCVADDSSSRSKKRSRTRSGGKGGSDHASGGPPPCQLEFDLMLIVTGHGAGRARSTSGGSRGRENSPVGRVRASSAGARLSTAAGGGGRGATHEGDGRGTTPPQVGDHSREDARGQSPPPPRSPGAGGVAYDGPLHAPSPLRGAPSNSAAVSAVGGRRRSLSGGGHGRNRRSLSASLGESLSAAATSGGVRGAAAAAVVGLVNPLPSRGRSPTPADRRTQDLRAGGRSDLRRSISRGRSDLRRSISRGCSGSRGRSVDAHSGARPGATPPRRSPSGGRVAAHSREGGGAARPRRLSGSFGASSAASGSRPAQSAAAPRALGVSRTLPGTSRSPPPLRRSLSAGDMSGGGGHGRAGSAAGSVPGEAADSGAEVAVFDPCFEGDLERDAPVGMFASLQPLLPGPLGLPRTAAEAAAVTETLPSLAPQPSKGGIMLGSGLDETVPLTRGVRTQEGTRSDSRSCKPM